MSRTRSAWLKAWDELDLEWQRLERWLLLLLFAVLLLVLLIRFAVAAVGVEPALWLAAVPVAVTLPLVLISATSASAWLCLRAQQQSSVESARASWLCAARWVLAGVACILLASASMRYLAFDIQMSSVAPFSLTGWWQLALLPIAFVLIGLRLLRQALREITPSA